jgi:ureidoglycolate dehydrogenase (NAD+)
MNISTSELTEKLKIAASKIVSEQEAQYFAEETVETHIRKAPRTSPLKSSIEDLGATLKREGSSINYAVDLPSFISVDFHGQGPLVYLKKVHDDLEERANNNGIVMAAFTNSKSMHTLHAWVQGLAKRGLLAIAICNGGPGAVIPLNGTKGLFGTNPIAYGIPGENGEIYCIDMATSEIPYFEILTAHKNNEPLKPNVAVDAKGEFTTNAAEALDFSESESDPYSNITPIGGGYKGYYITYLMEVMTSALIGMPSSPEMSSDFVPEEHGATLIVFSPKAMGTESKFNESIKALHVAIKNQTPKSGEKTVYPGEGNNNRYQELKDSDIEVDNELLSKLDSLIS